MVPGAGKPADRPVSGYVMILNIWTARHGGSKLTNVSPDTRRSVKMLNEACYCLSKSSPLAAESNLVRLVQSVPDAHA